MELDDGVGVFSEREVLAPPAARADAAPEAVAAEDQALEDATLLLSAFFSHKVVKNTHIRFSRKPEMKF